MPKGFRFEANRIDAVTDMQRVCRDPRSLFSENEIGLVIQPSLGPQIPAASFWHDHQTGMT